MDKQYKLGFKLYGEILFFGPFKYEGDIFIELETMYHSSGYALEVQAWCELAKVGDRYEDQDIVVEVI